MGWFEQLRTGLSKTRAQLNRPVSALFTSNRLDDETLEELESWLLISDVGPTTTELLLNAFEKQVKTQPGDAPIKSLAEIYLQHIKPLEIPLDVGTHRPFVVLTCGVNGAGKTTTIAKLAHHWQAQGFKILLAAGDTFRAAAVDQLRHWADTAGVEWLGKGHQEPAAIAFDAIQAGTARNSDIVIVDTAGRLPTQSNLMVELGKIKRVMAKANPQAPHEALLILDATQGQNVIQQLKAFDQALDGVTGLVLTKLDGTARGGIVAAIADQYPKPIRFIGVGEKMTDLQPFDANRYVDALFDYNQNDKLSA